MMFYESVAAGTIFHARPIPMVDHRQILSIKSNQPDDQSFSKEDTHVIQFHCQMINPMVNLAFDVM